MLLQAIEQVIGHRGASAYAPENTLAAFTKALALGCSYLEFDVMLSADGEPFVFHDDTLKRTTNGRGELRLVNTDYINSLDAGRWFSKRYFGEKIPHLAEVLQWLVASNVKANIELKASPGTAEQTAAVVLTCINRYWPQNKPLPLLSSFDETILSACRNLAPEMPLGLLLEKWEDNWLQKARELKCYSLHFNRRAINATRVQQVKEQGYALFVYTVNRKRLARKLLGWGVDAIFSDYPDLLA